MSNSQTKPTHARITTTRSIGEDTKEIVTESYTDKLSSYKREVAQNIRTSRNTLLSDIVGCLDVISKGETRELHIKIVANKSHEPELIVKTWTTGREYFGK